MNNSCEQYRGRMFINHQSIDGMRNQTNQLLSAVKNARVRTVNEMTVLNQNWAGKDRDKFMLTWADNREILYEDLIESLEAFDEALKNASNKYKSIQADAINRARSI